jgi:hypothetical protein
VGEDGVQAIAKQGGAVQTLAPRDWTLVAAQGAPRWGLALDEDDVYFSLDDGVGRVRKRGGASQTLASGRGARVVGVDDTEVFWLEDSPGTGGGPATTTVVATLKRGGPSRRVLADLPDVLAVVVAGDSVYWLSGTEGHTDGAIRRAPKTGADVAVLASGVPTYYGQVLSAEGDHLYWLEYPRGLHGPMRVRTMPAKGGAPVTLAEPFPTANKILLDPRHVCWAQDGVRCVALASWDTAHLAL